MTNKGSNNSGGSGYQPGPPSAKKGFNLASKLKKLGLGILGGAGWTLKQIFSKKAAIVALGVVPLVAGLNKCTNPEVNPTHDEMLTKTSATAFMDGAGSVYETYGDAAVGSVQWTFAKAREFNLLGGADDNTFSDPQNILICHPQHRYTIVPPTGVNIDQATRNYALISHNYYNEMDAKVGSIIADPNHRLNENLREYGWHPVIKYGSVHSNPDREVRITYAETPSQQTCGSHAFRPVRIPVQINNS